MPKHAKLTEQELANIVDDGGLNKNTIKQRKRIMDSFRKFAAEKEPPSDLDHLISTAVDGDTGPLETILMEFFASFRVGEMDELPKGNTIASYR